METTQLNEEIQAHLTSVFDAERITQLANSFAREGFVKIPEIVSPSTKNSVRREVLRLLDVHSERRDLLLATTDNTPRHMSVVRSEFIASESAIIPSISTSEPLLKFLGSIAREPLHASVSKDEEYLITRQEKKGDTHGWHWGDYSFALIWIIESPALEIGGMLQCVPHTRWDKARPRIHQYLCDNPIKTYGFDTGDVYLLRTDTTLHRTIPLTSDATRIILNMTWASTKDLHSSLAGNDRWWERKDVADALQA